jgi:cytochrome c oxidase subunit IV
MEHQSISPEISVHHHQSDEEFKRRIRKTTILLSVITAIELCLGLLMYATEFPSWVDMFIKGGIVILTLAKAFYIVSIFIHLGDEIRNMIMTIAVPLLLFVWFIAAFLWDGNEYRNLRNRYDRTKQEQFIKHNGELKGADTTRHSLD